MTSPLYLPASMVESGASPRAVCSRHGLPAARLRRVTFYSRTPWWVALLMLLSLLIALIVALAVRKTVVAPAWPACTRCEDRRRGMLFGVVLGVAAMALGLVIATATAELGPLLFTLAGIVAALVFAALAGWGDVVGGTVTADRAAVVLRRPAAPYRASLPPYPQMLAKPFAGYH